MGVATVEGKSGGGGGSISKNRPSRHKYKSPEPNL